MSKRKYTRRNKENVEFLENALKANVEAIIEGPKKKKWTKHDIKSIKPLTETQSNFFNSYYQGRQILACGSAGTGKSYIALYLAICDIMENRQEKIIIVRTAVQGREQGFLPGTQAEKNAPYENPYRDILASFFGKKSTYDDMRELGLIEFQTTAHLRGLTWDNCILIFDEIQNANFQEISTTITRLGKNSRILLLGDTQQNDLVRSKNDTSGFTKMVKVINNMSSFDIINFTIDDIVRGKIVKEWIKACEATNTVV